MLIDEDLEGWYSILLYRPRAYDRDHPFMPHKVTIATHFTTFGTVLVATAIQRDSPTD
jgi:hypothetical protein